MSRDFSEVFTPKSASGWLVVLCALGFLVGCATNPVTGESELALLPESWELDTGREQYVPARQMQGGDYTVDPSLGAYVSRVGQRMAAVSDRKLPYEFVVVNDSTPNAWALPGGKVAVNRGLLVELENEAELAAVLGHEAVHAAARHGAQGMERDIMLQGVVLATGIAVSNQDYGALVVGAASVAASLVDQKYSRDQEREADRYGMEYLARAGYDPRAAVTLQEKFLELSETDERQGGFAAFFSSHPPSSERVENNRRLARELGRSGDLGEERYRRATARLKGSRPAYEAFDKGLEALGKSRADEALRLAERAIDQEPGEARFYGLRGDALYLKGDYRAAAQSYSKALARDEGFFQHYLHRGLAREKLGDREGARQDFERSTKLLPTATAMNGLGQLALAEGDPDRAVFFLRQAAQSKSAVGKNAAATLAELTGSPDDLADRIDAGLEIEDDGELVLVLTNGNSVPVGGIEVAIRASGRAGHGRQRVGRFDGPLPPGASARLRTGIGPIREQSSIGRLQAVILGVEASL